MSQTPTAARWSALLDQHEASGLTLRAFAAQHDVNPSTLAWWRWHLGRTSPRSTSFVELVVADPTSEPQPVRLVVEHLPIHILVDAHTDLGLLRKTLEALC